MKITFPHMGNLYILVETLLKGLNLEVVPPPPISKRTIELGTKHSPEFACLPLKINLGNFIEALEAGADTILMAGGWGPCRFGYYAQVQRDILEALGYKFNMVILEAPDSRLSDLLKQLKALGEKVSFLKCIQIIKFAWYKLRAIEKLEKKFLQVLPRSLNKKLVEDIYDKAMLAIHEALNSDEVDRIVVSAVNRLNTVPTHNRDILRLGLVGEIYTVLEPAANYSIIRYLGKLDTEVDNSIYISEWVNDHLLGGLFKSKRKYIIDCARPYLNYSVGGHGLETVGTTVDFARRNFHGVIQIGPLTCMPEIVAQSVLGRVGREEGIPCMTLYFDEHSGTAGLYSRLEAFTDMLKRKISISQENLS